MSLSLGGFLKSYLVPALFLFCVPLFAYWFCGHAIDRTDVRLRETVVQGVRGDAELAPSEREQALEYFRTTAFSQMCLGKQPSAFGQETMGEICSEYDQFYWARSAAAFSLALGLLSVLVVLVCASVAFASRGAQYLSFVFGWNYLRIASALQTLVQGGLIVWLSFWMTALWFDRYVPKLILIAAALMAVACFLVVRAIFRADREPLYVEGELLPEARAGQLWARVRSLCSALGTSPPNHIVGGIDDNFFVTEGDVSVSNQLLQGRTLYVSLSLLRTMTREEADAVLAHEMAHFSGGDTAFSKKLAPGLIRYDAYLQALHEGVVTIPVYYFMRFYRALFELSLSKTSRERELRADRLAAEQTSPQHVAHALLKVAAYSTYRARVENQLFERNEKHESLGIADRVVSGFSGYSTSTNLSEDLVHSSFPHPFDSHPPLVSRLEAVQAGMDSAGFSHILAQKVQTSWLSAIEGAEEIEARLWSMYEERFAAAHERSLAYRYRPESPEQEAVVLKYFPEQTFNGCKNGPLVLSYQGIRLEASEEVVPFSAMKSVQINERLFKKHLDIKTVPGSSLKKLSVCISDLQYDNDAFVNQFNEYYGRHQVMASQADTSPADTDSADDGRGLG